jgi:undecaprenyl-diphosphatase
VIDSPRWKINLLALATAGIVGSIALSLLKVAVHSPRPLDLFHPDILAGRVYINVMFEPLYANSFPSGHTQTIFTVATVIAWASARAGKLNFWSGPGIFAVAVIVGLSRIYCGAHFPSDVLGGAVLGSWTALLCCLVMGRWLGRKKATDAYI